MTELPNGWETRTLKDWEMDAQSGFASGAHNSENKGVIHLRPMNISRLGKLDFETYKSVEDDSARRIVKGDILFNNTNSAELVGKTTLIDVDGDFAYSNHMTRLRFPVERVDHKYMSTFLHSMWMSGFFNEICSNHVNQASVSIKRLEQVEIPLPPLPEQHKIVEILEDHLSRLDAALADVKQAKVKAAQFRRSLLQAAFTGNLGSDGTRLMTSLPDHWKVEVLEKLLSETIGGIWGKESGTSEVDVSVIRVTELKSHGRIDPSTAVTRSVTQKQLASRELQEGDLLLEKSGGGPNSPVGRVGYFHQDGTRTVCSNFMQLMRPNPEIVVAKYLFYFLDGFHSNGGTIPLQTATTNIRNIKVPQFMAISVPFPPLPEQHKIVEILEDHLSRLDASLALADAMEKQSAGLRRSLLQAAFTGQLTKEVASV